MAAVPKLIYFSIAGRAEPIRTLFRLANLEFEDIRLSREEFAAKKAAGEFPYGQLPVLVVGDEVLAQSAAIARYVAKLGGFYPEDPLEAAKVDEVVDHVNDIGAAVVKTFFAKNDEEKAEMRRDLSENVLPPLLGALERRVHPTGPFVRGEKIGLADAVLAQTLQWLSSGVLDGVPVEILNDFPALVRIKTSVSEHPTLVAWHAAHPN